MALLYRIKAKVLPEPSGSYGSADLRFLGVSDYSTVFAGIHCDYPRRDGQAELTWVAGYTPTVTRLITNRARRIE